MNIVSDVKNVMEKNGVFVSEEDMNEELILDSLQFVSIIVELEMKFEIEIDDAFLLKNKCSSLNDFVVIIKEILDNM